MQNILFKSLNIKIYTWLNEVTPQAATLFLFIALEPRVLAY